MTTALERFDAAVALARAALARDSVAHEYSARSEEDGGFGMLHRLVVNGDPGPWTSRHAFAAHGMYRASTESHFDGKYPRVFFVIPVAEQTPSPAGDSSSQQCDFHPDDPGEVAGSGAGPAGSSPQLPAGPPRYATAGTLRRELLRLIEAVERRPARAVGAPLRAAVARARLVLRGRL